MDILLYTGLFVPLCSFLLLLFGSPYLSRKIAGIIGSGSILIAFLCFVRLLFLYTSQSLDPLDFILFKWISVPAFSADFALRLDPLSLVMTLIITGVGFLIHVYSNGYMDEDPDYSRFFACMNFFVFSMLLLVLAQNLLLLFVGWEGVGLASYLLIGFWYTTPTASDAAFKAFILNRIGDFAFLMGILLTLTLFGTSDIAAINKQAVETYPIGSTVIGGLTLLLFIGAIGKSAQLPLFTWLPDAMAGPTPVSALIHAATMVTAGIYLLVRLNPVYMLAPTTLHIVAIVGGLSSLFASLCAVGQTDFKKVLAYSTMSQLGLMFLACGVAAFYAAIFHLMTHAFVKALLFLSAGIIVHRLHGETNLYKMGGLAKRFKITHWLFLIGVFALSGIPPLSAFFSKDMILEQDYLAGFTTLFYVGLAASILTGFYLVRAYCLAFLGPISEKNLGDRSEGSILLLAPTLTLAFLAVFGGFIGFTFGKEASLEKFLGEIGITLFQPASSTTFITSPETWLSIIGCTLGLVVSAVMYTKYVNRFKISPSLLSRSFYVNEIYTTLFVRPFSWIAGLINQSIEPHLANAPIAIAERGTSTTARLLQAVQSGQVRSYAAWMAIGSVILLAIITL